MTTIEEVEKAIRHLADIEDIELPIQAFNTRNWIGDYMTLFFHKGKTKIYYCYDYGYIELLGNDTLFKKLRKKGILY